MENHVRIFREQPFGWFDKPILRYLRKKYGKNKKVFTALRSTYLAICEMESDFERSPITAFNKTVGTYAGLSREAVGKYVRMLEEEGLIQKVRVVDETTRLKAKGTYIQILSSQEFFRLHPERGEGEWDQEKPKGTTHARVSGYPDIRTSGHSDMPTVIKKISISKKVSKYKNVKKKNAKETEDGERSDYYAELIADKLGDKKSLSYFKIACRLFPPERLLEKASAIVSDGGAKNPAAVFASWLKEEQAMKATPAKSRAHIGHRALVPAGGGISKSLMPTSAYASEQSGFPAVGFGCVGSASVSLGRRADAEKLSADPPCAPDSHSASFPHRTTTLNVDE